jgi:tripartite-type tricarboxylate transporter receptor subunit TctC
MKFLTRSLIIAGFAFVLLCPRAAWTQASFYEGKTITMIRGGAPGGVGEMRTRAVANFLRKHVPGKPTVILEFMAGAGGAKAANHMYRGARADGLVIGALPSGMVSSAVWARPESSTIWKNLSIWARPTASRITFFLPTKSSGWTASPS